MGERTLWQAAKREPFGLCACVAFATFCIAGYRPPLWSLPIAVAAWIAVTCADELWQFMLDSRCTPHPEDSDRGGGCG